MGTFAYQGAFFEGLLEYLDAKGQHPVLDLEQFRKSPNLKSDGCRRQVPDIQVDTDCAVALGEKMVDGGHPSSLHEQYHLRGGHHLHTAAAQMLCCMFGPDDLADRTLQTWLGSIQSPYLAGLGLRFGLGVFLWIRLGFHGFDELAELAVQGAQAVDHTLFDLLRGVAFLRGPDGRVELLP